MTPREGVLLAPFTTFRIGGPATLFVEAESEEDVKAAVALARDRGLPLLPLGGGSNLLVPDEGVKALVLKLNMADIRFEETGNDVLLIASAGAIWDEVVEAAIERNLYGIENLAGVPGTIGGATVQNIGAYGGEFSEVFAYAEVINIATGDSSRVTRAEAAFSYRMSAFKKKHDTVIVRTALRLSRAGTLRTDYADLQKAKEAGVSVSTPREVAEAVRAIRARKFPGRGGEGTAGSFFKNPVMSAGAFAALAAQYPELPSFPQPDGSIKIPLAWILDHMLSLKGYAVGTARLFENQPLAIVTQDGATANEVNALANDVVRRVQSATNILVEREVETFDENR